MNVRTDDNDWDECDNSNLGGVMWKVGGWVVLKTECLQKHVFENGVED